METFQVFFCVSTCRSAVCDTVSVSPARRLNWETFVVRLWREKVNGAWRGEIVHTTSHASSHFTTLAQLRAFISRFAEGIENQTNEHTQEETDD